MKNNPKSDKPAPKAVGKASAKVFDVRRPGKALASPTSRPVIASHKPTAHTDQAAVSGVGERALLSHKTKINLRPPSSPSTASADTPTAKSVKVTVAQEEREEAAIAAAAVPSAVEPPAIPSQPPTAVVTLPKLTPPSASLTPAAPAEPSDTPPSTTAQPTVPADNPTLAASEQPSTSEPEQPKPSATPTFPPSDLSQLHTDEPAFEDLIVVSHHGRTSSVWEVLLLIALALIFVAVALDILLDLEVLSLPIPHTNWL